MPWLRLDLDLFLLSQLRVFLGNRLVQPFKIVSPEFELGHCPRPKNKHPLGFEDYARLAEVFVIGS